MQSTSSPPAAAPTPTRTADVVVIGAGTAGLAAYRAATAVTSNVLLIEGGAFGTTCARVGCMPSKLLLAAAEVSHHARHGRPFGITAAVEVDGHAVMDRVRRERDRFVSFVVDSVDRLPVEHKVIGKARLAGPHTVLVNDEVIRANSIVIATGSSPFIPPILKGLGDRLIVNDDVFSWDRLPSSVAVFGTGVIGLELGQALHRLGVRVRIFGKGGTIGPLTDPVVRAAARKAFEAELPLHAEAHVLEVRRVDTGSNGEPGVNVTFELDGQTQTEFFAYALVAAGRRPNVGSLGLESTGLVLDAQGVPHFDRYSLQCGTSSIFIAGDANHDIPLLHEAADEGKIAGENAARFPQVKPGPRRSLLSITFTDPQLAIAGETFASVNKRLAEQGGPVIGSVSFEDQGRSRVMLQNRGACRIYADPASGLFLGAEMAGPRAENIGHLLAWAHQQELTVDRMLSMPFYHPVVEEGIRTALRDASAQLANRTAAALGA